MAKVTITITDFPEDRLQEANDFFRVQTGVEFDLSNMEIPFDAFFVNPVREQAFSLLMGSATAMVGFSKGDKKESVNNSN
jgi:hypothetical protein